VLSLSRVLIVLSFTGVLPAVSVDSAFIFSAFSSPSNASAPSFLFNGLGQYGYNLNLNGSGVATSATHLGAGHNVGTLVQKSLTYQSHSSGNVDTGEVNNSAMASRVNSEISRLDDVGFVDESTDAHLNVDIDDGGWVTFRSPGTASRPLYNLLIAEDAGLDPFKLEYCPTASCSTGKQVLFNGFSNGAYNTLMNSGNFQTGDTVSNIHNAAEVRKLDQLYFFEFAQPIVGGYFKISETSNYGGTTLELDFAGGMVPEPQTYVLMATVGIALALARARRNRNKGIAASLVE
jgi:hypothetical protein